MLVKIEHAKTPNESKASYRAGCKKVMSNISEKRICQNCRGEFIIEPDDFGFYEKIGVPPPTFCPECRFQRRLMWRNERTFYKRTCDLCKKNIISTYDKNQSFPVYCQKCWWSDKWNPYEYGIDFDFSRPFFEQFKELLSKVPMLNMQNDDGVGSVNSEYAQDFAFSKNCYLTSVGWYCDNVMYSYYTCYDRDVVDSFFINNSEKCYECFESDRLFDSKYSHLCFDSVNLNFCYDMRNCQNCFMCTNLRGQNYYIRNEPYTREAYFEELKKENLDKKDKIDKHRIELKEMMLKCPNRFVHIIKSLNCTGDMLINSKMSLDSFWVSNLENCRYLMLMDGAKNSYDCNNSGNPELCYESVTPDNSFNNLFTIFCWKCSYVFYSNNCHSSNNLFGCIGLKHGEYSIFNKRYTKEEYTELRKKIIEHMKKTGEWGEFFPSIISPYSYNESFNLDFFFLNRNEAIDKGFSWKEDKERNYIITLHKEEIPNSIDNVDENILNEVIECQHSGNCEHKCSKAFKIIERELKFYKKMNIPIPTLCPNCRYYERLKQTNPLKLWHRKCMKPGCNNEFETSYAPDRPEIVYCEKCYQQEVY